MKKIPIILDTDLGADVDDAWAIAMLLKSPELDIKLITSGTGDTTARATLIAKMLQVAGRTDIPIGIGIPTERCSDLNSLKKWGDDYDLKNYPGPVYQDGIQAMIDCIMNSTETITLIAIGPVPNLSAALDLEPQIASKVKLVGMFGALRKGYEGQPTVTPEYNVHCFIPECQKVFTAPWEMAITPLDTCGIIRLEGARYQRIKDSHDPLVKAVMENYKVWCEANNQTTFDEKTSVLFDTVAIYMAYSEEFLEMETLGVRIAEDGKTVIDPDAKKVRCAMDWNNMEGYLDHLTDRLCGN